MGTESGIVKPGLRVFGGWIEANHGLGVRLGSGDNLLIGVNYVANGTTDLRIDGGRYEEYDVTHEDANNNIFEAAQLTPGSRITGGRRAGMVKVDRTRTSVPGASWATYTPVISSQSGSLKSAAATGSYDRDGATVKFSATLTIAANGSGAGWINISLPPNLAVATGRNFAVSGLDTVAPAGPSLLG